LEQNDVSAARTAMEALERAMQWAGQAAYATTGAGGGSPDGPAGADEGGSHEI
jgi:hypothetical protein